MCFPDRPAGPLQKAPDRCTLHCPQQEGEMVPPRKQGTVANVLFGLKGQPRLTELVCPHLDAF